LLTLPAHQLVYTVENVEYTKTTNQQLEHENKKLKSEMVLLEGQFNKLHEKFSSLVRLIKKQKVTISRPTMTQPRRLEIAASQEWKCKQCSRLLSSVFEIDHIIRWTDSYDDSKDNLQPLCVECHKLKTAKENEK
jgi:SMC interacting uncharacterized protein involved in chromosome segregation